MALENVMRVDNGNIIGGGGGGGASKNFQGTIEEWNALSTAEKKAYDHASIPDSLDGNVTFPASKVMMLDGASVEADLASAVPRTVTGTTLAQLVTALGNLTSKQQALCRIAINSYTTIPYGGSTYVNTSCNTSGEVVTRMLNTNNSTYKKITVANGQSTSVDEAITAWTLYYQGSPIS